MCGVSKNFTVEILHTLEVIGGVVGGNSINSALCWWLCTYCDCSFINL